MTGSCGGRGGAFKSRSWSWRFLPQKFISRKHNEISALRLMLKSRFLHRCVTTSVAGRKAGFAEKILPPFLVRGCYS